MLSGNDGNKKVPETGTFFILSRKFAKIALRKISLMLPVFVIS